MTNKEKLEFEARIKDLELQWQDHFHARNQTWKALSVSAALAVALIGLDWQTDEPIVTLIASLLLALVAIFGMQITIRHRNYVETKKFKAIIELEKSLGLNSDYIIPYRIKWWYVFNVRKSNTSLFILRMQFVVLIFAIINLILRLNLIFG
jgi:hypothetical protein